jgi:hypothetical protein
VLPPRNILFPVLPYRTDKLTFPLCRACADGQIRIRCLHSDEERSLTGVWATPELGKALEQGYKVLEIFEVYHYPQRQDMMFAEYINKFLGLKVESSGWPSWAKTDEQRAEYVAEFFRREAVQLDPTKIEKNPGLRMIAKLCLNSFCAYNPPVSTIRDSLISVCFFVGGRLGMR